MNLKPIIRNSPRRSRARGGFSLMEFMVAIGLASIVFAAVMALTLFGTRSSLAIVNYSDLDAKSRYALDLFSREIRQATAVTSISTNGSSQSLTFTNASQGVTVSLNYDTNAHTVTMVKTGQPDFTALTGCDRFDFNLYQRTPLVTATNILYYPATNTSGVLTLSMCKLISLDWKCSRQILAQKVNTESVQAAQIVLRNKQ
jgi:Prokaryotic N-terminal methylation motif